VEAVRSALMAVGRNRPGGQVVPLEALQARITATLGAHYSCRQDNEVGAALPDLIRDPHSSIAAGRDAARLLELAVLLHSGATLGWLRVAGAHLDLWEQAAQLVHRVASIVIARPRWVLPGCKCARAGTLRPGGSCGGWR
jgi:hypothetical protein